MPSHAVLTTVTDQPGMLFRAHAGARATRRQHRAHRHRARAARRRGLFRILERHAIEQIVSEMQDVPGSCAWTSPPSFAKIYGKRIVIMGGGAQVGQVAMGAILEADRHNIRGEHISVDTIPARRRTRSGGRRTRGRPAAAREAPRAGRRADGRRDYEGGRRRAREGPARDLAEHGRQRPGRCRPGRDRSGSGRRDGGDGRGRHGQVRHHAAAEEAVLQEGQDRRRAGKENVLRPALPASPYFTSFSSAHASSDLRGIERFLRHELLLHDAFRVDDERRPVRTPAPARSTRRSSC